MQLRTLLAAPVLALAFAACHHDVPNILGAQSFFDGVTHFDDFARDDTEPGTITPGPQGQSYTLVSNSLLAADHFARIAGHRFVMAPPTEVGNRAAYALTNVAGTVRRMGVIMEYGPNQEATPGPYGYVWALILAQTGARFTDNMIHLTGTDQSWHLEIWYPDGHRKTLGEGPITPALAQGQRGVVDFRLSGNHASLRLPGGSTQNFEDEDLRSFGGARYLVFEHFTNGPTANVNRFLAYYYQVDAAPAADPSIYAPFEGMVR